LLIAILVCHDSSAEDFSVRVFELSNGKELNRFSLPLREWQNLTSVDHHQITAVARVPDPNELEHIKKLFSFDLDSVPVGKETERPELERRIDKSYRVHTNWEEFDHGVDWRAEGRFGYSEPVWFWKCWDQCVGLLAAKKEDVKASLARLRLLPAKSRWVYYESPVFSETFSFQIAPDGKSFAAHSLEGELSVWNVNSFPRWPWALAASLGTLLLILLVGRSRSKRLARALDPLSLKGSPATPRAEGPGK
jgi:hypothetical protein